MNLVTFHSWWTLVLLIVFVGIVLWAYSSKRKATFEEYGRIPLDDDDAPGARRDGGTQGANHG